MHRSPSCLAQCWHGGGLFLLLPAEVEITRHRANIEREIQGYGAFLGVPFLFTSYRNAIRYMGFGSDQAMYILLQVDKSYPVSQVQQSLKQRLREVTLLTFHELAYKPRMYRTTKTGAVG